MPCRQARRCPGRRNVGTTMVKRIRSILSVPAWDPARHSPDRKLDETSLWYGPCTQPDVGIFHDWPALTLRGDKERR